MELRHIRYFLAVADAQNFTRAAATLGIGQPPLSQQIKDLEQEVGVLLFRRIPQGAELTEAGRAFLAIVESFPAQVASAIQAARRAARGETGSVRVGFTGSAAFNPLVSGAIRAFRRRYAEVELSLREGNSNELADALRDGRLDAAFLRPDAVNIETLQIHVLEAEPMVAAIPSGLPVGGDSRVALAALAGEPFILTPRALGPTLFDATVNACRSAGFEPILGQSAPQIASVLALVAAEMGVALVPDSMRQAAMKGVRYLELDDARCFANLVIAHRRSETALPTRHFVDQARSELDRALSDGEA